MSYNVRMEHKFKKMDAERLQLLLKAYVYGTSIEKLCQQFGLCRTSIIHHVRTSGVTRRNSGRPPLMPRNEARYIYLRQAAWKYKISISVLLQLFKQQRSKCKLCSAKIRIRNGRRRGTLCIDHDHRTGKVRGLLCYGCNVGIGKIGDSPLSLLKAAAYVAEARGHKLSDYL